MDRYDPATFPNGGWQRAAFCGPNGGNCIEVNLGKPGLVGIRDSKPAAGPALVLSGDEWGAFLDAAKSGRVNRA
jgi:Domain of unknown function (DUF397)